MTLEEITNGLRKLLLDNNYNPTTIKFYERDGVKSIRYPSLTPLSENIMQSNTMKKH